MFFKDRLDAGNKLKEKLEKFKDEEVVIFPLLRGGLPVAFSSIINLNYKWNILITKKIPFPYNEEVAIGAVDLEGNLIINKKYIDILKIEESYIEKKKKEKVEEIKKKLKFYGGEEIKNLEGKTAIIVDDGIATGYTALAAIDYLKNFKPSKIILAVPLISERSLKDFIEKVDELIYIYSVFDFHSVGSYYKNFTQLEDDEILNLITKINNLKI